jgi:pimeloyl-ACP methyl ester carboxylesterase
MEQEPRPDRAPGGIHTEESTASVEPEPFHIHVDDADIEDLRRRLRETRWPHALDDADWSMGSNLRFVQDLVEHWSSYDWREHEEYLNGFNHFRVPVQGLAIHYVHERGRGPAPVPILLGHSCYSSFYEFHRVIRELADPASFGGDPADAFDVVAWSLPGFAFSEKPSRRGWDCARMADAAQELMTSVLGYDRYGAVGGSWGGVVAWFLGVTYPDTSLGLFLTQTPAQPHQGPGEPPLSEAELDLIQRSAEYDKEETGYRLLLSTRPESIAFGLADSPAGHAGWVAEKLRVWSDCHGALGSTVPIEEILTSMSITWFTQSIASGQRIYYESAHGWSLKPDDRIAVRTGAMSLPGGLPYEAVPAETVRRRFNLDYYVEAPRGGHWPAWEVPEVFIEAVREFYRPIRGRS